MKKAYWFTSMAILILILVPSSGFGQEFNLEKVSGDRIFVLASCDHLHATDGESACTDYHIIIKKSAEAGQEVLLNGEPYVIEWLGAGYYTASGKVLQTTGDASQGRLGLLEVRPHSGHVHQAAWQDVDRDGQLGVGDTVTVNGRNESIVDKRLNVRVKAVQ